MPRDVRKLRKRSQYRKGVEEDLPEYSLTGGRLSEKQRSLRYGRNPPAFKGEGGAALYRERHSSGPTIPSAKKLHGTVDLSYINISDGDAGIRLAYRLHQLFPDDQVAIIIKHEGPSGVARARTMKEADELAYLCDPKSPFGGVNVYVGTVDKKTAQQMMDPSRRPDVVIAPDYTRQALAVLKERKELRILRVDSFGNPIIDSGIDGKQILGGELKEQRQVSHIDSYENFEKVSSGKNPTQQQIEAALFNWAVALHTPSNAVVFGRPNHTVGIGRGQASRIYSAIFGIYLANNICQGEGKGTIGTVMASDAFFPFPDAVEAAGEAKVSAIVYPMGSVRDEEALEMAEKYGIIMLCTRPNPETKDVERAFSN